MTRPNKTHVLLSAIVSLIVMSCSTNRNSVGSKYITIREQGSFAAGGTVIANPGVFDPYKPTAAGQTLRGDHAYVFYQIPVKA